MSSFFRDRLEYAVVHESYYLENELTRKLNDLFKEDYHFKVEFDNTGFRIQLSDNNPIGDKDFIIKRIREVLGITPVCIRDNRFFSDYHRLTFTVEWGEVFKVK